MTSMPSVQTFNFTSDSTGWVEIDGQAPSIILQASSLRMMAWAYFPSLDDFISADGDTVAFIYCAPVASMAVVPDGSTLQLWGQVLDTDNNAFDVSGGPVPIGQWVMLELVWTQGGTFVALVNGVQVASVAASTQPVQKPNSTTSYIGNQQFNGSPGLKFTGMIQSFLLVNSNDYTTANQFFAIMPSNAISSWGGSTCDLNGSASIVTWSAPPSTPYGGMFADLPPAPTSLSDPMPSSASSGPTFQMVVPNSDSSQLTLLSIAQNWAQLVPILGQPHVTTGHTVSVTTGLEVSDSETQTLGVSLGLSSGFDIGILSAQLNLTLSWSESFTNTITVSEQTTVQNDAAIDNPPETMLGWWWQQSTTMTTLQFVNDSGITVASVANPLNGIDVMTYPAANQGFTSLTPASQSAARAAE